MRSYKYAGSALLLAALLAVAPACASGGYYVGAGYSSGYRVDAQRRAYNEGYRAGLDRGVRDLRSGHRFDYNRHGEYRHADRGYWSGFGDRGYYRDLFRRGFQTGYTTAFRGTGFGYGVPRGRF